MSKLIGKDPMKTEPRKPKIVEFGQSGVGKTWFALSFPNVFYIDSEGGASRSHYMERLAKSNGRYVGPEDGANDFDTIISQTEALATEKHSFKTVVYDSITKPFISSIAAEGERLGSKNAFGADKKPAVQYMRRLIAKVHRLDMNVIFIAHEKAEWGEVEGKREEIGRVADVYDKLIYEMDLAFQVVKRGPLREGVVKKSRLQGFPEASRFTLDYETFAEMYGKDVIMRPTEPIALATQEQVDQIKYLVDLLKIEQATVDKWLEKCNAENFSEMNTNQANKVIENLKSKIK